jgi:hypothetical protein
MVAVGNRPTGSRSAPARCPSRVARRYRLSHRPMDGQIESPRLRADDKAILARDGVARLAGFGVRSRSLARTEPVQSGGLSERARAEANIARICPAEGRGFESHHPFVVLSAERASGFSRRDALQTSRAPSTGDHTSGDRPGTLAVRGSGPSESMAKREQA